MPVIATTLSMEGRAVKLPESTIARMPPELQRLFRRLPNAARDEVLAAFPDAPGQSGAVTGQEPSTTNRNTFGLYNQRATAEPRGDDGSAARFFYAAKAGPYDRFASKHPTVKPVELMRWLVRLVTPPGGTVLDPFAGTGTTGAAAMIEGFDCILMEREAQYVADIERRIAWMKGNGPLTEQALARKVEPETDLPLFSGDAA